jgi:hypothetical protein
MRNGRREAPILTCRILNFCGHLKTSGLHGENAEWFTCIIDARNTVTTNIIGRVGADWIPHLNLWTNHNGEHTDNNFNIFNCSFQLTGQALCLCVCVCVCVLYTGCPRRNGQNFGRMFLMLKYTDIIQNTYIQSWTVTEIMAREKCGLLWDSTHCTWQLTRYRCRVIECAFISRRLSSTLAVLCICTSFRVIM